MMDPGGNLLEECTNSGSIYELPEGNIITIGSERFRCPEVLFQYGLHYAGHGRYCLHYGSERFRCKR